MFGKKSDSWLIVGLGNPGKDYAHTRHNCGFLAIDILAESLGCKIDKGKFQGLYEPTIHKGTKIFLLKPTMKEETFRKKQGAMQTAVLQCDYVSERKSRWS